MNLSDIILNCNNVSFDSFVCQTSVQTEKDKTELKENNYPFVFTETEFQSFMAGVDPKNIYYIPSIAASAIYFNKETLAVCPCHIELMWMAFQNGENKTPRMLRTIASVEADVANMDFSSSLMAVPDGARCEYFNKLLKKFPDGGKIIPNLFQLFFSFYADSDRLRSAWTCPCSKSVAIGSDNSTLSGVVSGRPGGTQYGCGIP